MRICFPFITIMTLITNLWHHYSCCYGGAAAAAMVVLLPLLLAVGLLHAAVLQLLQTAELLTLAAFSSDHCSIWLAP